MNSLEANWVPRALEGGVFHRFQTYVLCLSNLDLIRLNREDSVLSGYSGRSLALRNHIGTTYPLIGRVGDGMTVSK